MNRTGWERRQELLETLEVRLDFQMKDRLARALSAWVAGQGGAFTGDPLRVARGSGGWRIWAIPARFPLPKARAPEVRRFIREVLEDPGAWGVLRAQGVGGPVRPVVFAWAAEAAALAVAREAGVGLLLSHQGMVMAPRQRSLGEEAKESA